MEKKKIQANCGFLPQEKKRDQLSPSDYPIRPSTRIHRFYTVKPFVFLVFLSIWTKNLNPVKLLRPLMFLRAKKPFPSLDGPKNTDLQHA